MGRKPKKKGRYSRDKRGGDYRGERREGSRPSSREGGRSGGYSRGGSEGYSRDRESGDRRGGRSFGERSHSGGSGSRGEGYSRRGRSGGYPGGSGSRGGYAGRSDGGERRGYSNEGGSRGGYSGRSRGNYSKDSGSRHRGRNPGIKNSRSRFPKDDEGGHGGGFGAGFDREKFMKRAREQTTEVLRSRDMYLAYLSNAIEEEERVANQLVERLEELYGLYFPELRVEDRRNYALIISKIYRDKVDVDSIKQYVGEGKALQISEAGKKSIGGDFEQKDVDNMRKMAEEIESIYALMNRHEKYLDDVAQQVCPNLRYLIGAKVAGKLIAAAGGIKKLALMPASTVQVIGAEKALFKHLRNKNIAPPKHGIIFQHNSISTSPKAVRGKIARALATKITLAVKADVYTKRFIGPQIKDKFEKRFKDILSKAGTAKRREREEE